MQTFPDKHKFIYDNVTAGYKMIGNAVPCNLGYQIANSIKEQLNKRKESNSNEDSKPSTKQMALYL